MVREGQKRKNRGSSPKIDKSPQLAGLNNLNGSSPFILFSQQAYLLVAMKRKLLLMHFSSQCVTI